MERVRKQSQKKKAKEEELSLQDIELEKTNAVPNCHSSMAFE